MMGKGIKNPIQVILTSCLVVITTVQVALCQCPSTCVTINNNLNIYLQSQCLTSDCCVAYEPNIFSLTGSAGGGTPDAELSIVNGCSNIGSIWGSNSYLNVDGQQLSTDQCSFACSEELFARNTDTSPYYSVFCSCYVCCGSSYDKCCGPGFSVCSGVPQGLPVQDPIPSIEALFGQQSFSRLPDIPVSTIVNTRTCVPAMTQSTATITTSSTILTGSACSSSIASCVSVANSGHIGCVNNCAGLRGTARSNCNNQCNTAHVTSSSQCGSTSTC